MSMIERILSSLKLPASCTRFDKTLFKSSFMSTANSNPATRSCFKSRSRRLSCTIISRRKARTSLPIRMKRDAT